MDPIEDARAEARSIIARAKAGHDVDELVWEIIYFGMPKEEPPARDDMMAVAELTEEESMEAALAWVESMNQIEDIDAYWNDGLKWRQVV